MSKLKELIIDKEMIPILEDVISYEREKTKNNLKL